jgi:hypothetical protein
MTIELRQMFAILFGQKIKPQCIRLPDFYRQQSKGFNKGNVGQVGAVNSSYQSYEINPIHYSNILIIIDWFRNLFL